MENFFIEEEFCSDLQDLMDYLDIEEPKNLRSSWMLKVELTDLEPIFKISDKKLLELLVDNNEERLHEDFDGTDESRILKAINGSCDFVKLNELMPKYYFPNGKFAVITKQDLLNYLI